MQWQTNLPLIAILRGITPDEALAHVGAVIDAGFDAVEIPLNSPQWEKSIPQVVDAYGEQALIGAGTVLQPEQVDRLAAMGCRLIVTPNIQPEVIRRAVGYGMTVCPGCATASEIQLAWELGLKLVKFFPAEQLGGVAMLSALGAVFQRLQHRCCIGVSVDFLLQAAHEVEHLAFVAALVAAQGLQRGDIKGHALGQSAQPLLLGAFLDQPPRLVGQIGYETDLLRVGIAHCRVKLA